MAEEILYKASRTGTTIVFFDSLMPITSEGQHPAFVILDPQNNPLQIKTFDGINKWVQHSENNTFVKVENLGYPTITGTVFTQTVDYTLKQSQRDRIADGFKEEMFIKFSGLSTTHVIFEEQLTDDLFVNIFLQRTTATLDTLDIYNNLVNSVPIQQSETGTVFGKIEALQKIKDEGGSNIRIPLRNVPVGIFAPSQSFPASTSVDDNGDRIRLNLTESALRGDYFNVESFQTDVSQFLYSGSPFSIVPEHYKYITYTNDEGEFVINNAPIGTQVLIFEVDLFRQGLTKDEVALNFFPFPADISPNVDSVPSFFFKQVPIDVVPTWGNFQTGYTEVNIKANLDLRKWSTYFLPPISVDGKNIEFLRSRGNDSPYTIQARDMSQDGFPIRSVELVEVEEMINREPGQQLLWRNEFKQLKSKAEFRTDGWHCFKLPANMYDSSGQKTDHHGRPIMSKGVWLAGYQFKLHYDSPGRVFRSTGLEKTQYGNSLVTRSHFDLNKNIENFESDSSSLFQVGIGVFPYERKWNHNYPTPYSIPAIPTKINPDFGYLDTNGKRLIEQPRFLDGDLIGAPYDIFQEDDGISGGTGGFGVSYDRNTGRRFKNDFAKLVTKNYLYKYENRGDKSEKYACGYEPNNSSFPLWPGVSIVQGGEKYQRTECGYGYFMKPEGWARVAHYPIAGGSDALYAEDVANFNTTVNVSMGASQYFNSLLPYDTSMGVLAELSGQKETLNFGTASNIKEGGIELYRVVNSNPLNLVPLQPTPNKTTIRLNFGEIKVQNEHTTGLFNRTKFQLGSEKDQFEIWGDDIRTETRLEGKLYIRNLGVKASEIKFISGSEFFLEPGQAIELQEFQTGMEWNNMVMEVEGNNDYDYENQFYTKATYKFEFRNIQFYRNDNSGIIRKTNTYSIDTVNFATQLDVVGNYYMMSESMGVRIKTNIFNTQNCNGDHWNPRNIRYRGIYMDGFNNKLHSRSFFGGAMGNFTCDEYPQFLVI